MDPVWADRAQRRGVERTATRVELRKPRLAEHLERELGYLGYYVHFCIRGR